MALGAFEIGNKTQLFSVITDNISGEGGRYSPTINIPIEFNWSPPISLLNNEVISFELTSIKAELTITDRNLKCAEITQLYSHKIEQKKNFTLHFPFLLSESIISRIEQFRKENLPLTIKITVQVGIYDNSFFLNYKNERVLKSFISSYHTATGNSSFQIEQSYWISKILPSIGHDSYKLVEIPLFNQIIPDEYYRSIAEFEQARKYFINGDYDKTVAHCRSALEPFSNKANFQKLKEFVKSKSEFEWATKVLESTDEWLDKIIKATSSFTSKTHHVPSVGHFGRTEAEIVLMISTGIIAYIGKIEYKPE